MIRKLYAVRDMKAGIFNAPTIMDNDAVAIRSFGDVVNANDKSTVISLHPADFAVCFVGTFDLETGVITPVEGGFKQLATGADFAIKE